MAYKNNESFVSGDRYKKPVQNRLSQQQLLELDKELDSFTNEKEVNFPHKMTVKVFDEVKWLKSKGALADERIVTTNFKSAVYGTDDRLKEPTDCDPILFEQLSMDLEQWRWWKGRKEFVENKRIEGLEELAEKMDYVYNHEVNNPSDIRYNQ